MPPLAKIFRKSRVGKFLVDATGVAAIEFAYLVPILMLMMFGTFEISRALMAHKRFQRATAMVGDLVAREEQLGSDWNASKQTLDGILRSAEHVMIPYSNTPLKMGILQLRADSSDATKTTVEWSYSYHSKTVEQCPAIKSMPSTGMITKGNAALIVEAEYKYTPYLLNILPGLIKEMTWNDTMVFAPRDGSVDYKDGNPSGCPS